MDKKDFVSNKDLLESNKNLLEEIKIKVDVAELKQKTVNVALVEEEEIEVLVKYMNQQ